MDIGLERACPWRSLLLALPLLIGSAQGARALRPTADYAALPSDYGILYEEVDFMAGDGLRLRGWFYPAQDTTALAECFAGRLVPMPAHLKPPQRPYALLGEAPRPTLIVCNGDAGNMAALILYAYRFCTRGFNVLTFDWRGFGGSEAWAIEADHLVYPEFLLDYAAAIDYAKGRRETDPAQLGLFGFSTGAYLSFAIAAQRDDIGAIACRGLITSFADVLPILAALNPERKLQVPADFPQQWLPAAAAPHMAVPTFLIVGEADVRTPPWMSRSVYERLAGPRELWVVPGATHGGAEAPEYIDYPAFFVRVGAFFRHYLEGPAGPVPPSGQH